MGKIKRKLLCIKERKATSKRKKLAKKLVNVNFDESGQYATIVFKE